MLLSWYHSGPLKLGILAAIKSGTQAVLAELFSRNFSSVTLLPLQAPPHDSRQSKQLKGPLY